MAAIRNGYAVRDCNTAAGYLATQASTSSSSNSICARRWLEDQRHIGRDAQAVCRMGQTVVQDQTSGAQSWRAGAPGGAAAIAQRAGVVVDAVDSWIAGTRQEARAPSEVSYAIPEQILTDLCDTVNMF